MTDSITYTANPELGGPRAAETIDAPAEEKDLVRRGLDWRHAAMAVSAGMMAAAAGVWGVRRRRRR